MSSLEKKIGFNTTEAKWYIVRVHSGSEHKVVDAIKKNIPLYGADVNDFVEFFVPSVSKEEFKNSVKTEVKKSLYPGYIVIKMKLNEKSWLVITKTDKVSGFLCAQKGKPKAISEKEYQKMVENVQQNNIDIINNNSVSAGSRIKVKSGSFESFEGFVRSVDEKSGVLTVSVSIFDRETTIELKPDQVEIIHTKD